ncbi:adenylyltransferase/sulfurtransferase [Kineococcus xinjiangensis]|uniref:Adenylyltransferase/sulfurtransferase n=1 Tax=Kineococcus xinjiangensis TaxID=512762 RepID=A0A2S6IPF4_9ACTN|nr:molybdopterin-synthase adenylyltransferase MoeB [Kineococcus xinjiangensis]PPK95976.1 adenylyltransferase/sulfurtransferase [Kineococcus xinjiangensis]
MSGQRPGPLVEPGPDLTAEEVRRYARHLLLPEIGREGQRRLKNARVLVVGAGGLGSPVLLYLAAAGVGTLGVVDDDVVDESNLQRQVVHATADVGRAKADSARETVSGVNPLVDVVLHRERLTPGNAAGIVAGYDLVLDGSDNFPTRYLVNDICTAAGVPCVWGAVLRFGGQVSISWEAHGPQYRDLYPAPPAPEDAPSCEEAGVLGAICGAVGSVMAAEAVKLITGAGRPLLGRLLVLDALAMTWRTLTVAKDPTRAPAPVPSPVEATGGPACAVPVAEALPEVGAVELAGMLRAREAGGPGFVLVDVRPPHERDIVAIPGAVNVPLARIASGEALAELPADADVVLHCKSGGRSAQALTALRAAGRTRVRHLRGGVLAWIDEVDPDLPRY